MKFTLMTSTFRIEKNNFALTSLPSQFQLLLLIGSRRSRSLDDVLPVSPYQHVCGEQLRAEGEKHRLNLRLETLKSVIS